MRDIRERFDRRKIITSWIDSCETEPQVQSILRYVLDNSYSLRKNYPTVNFIELISLKHRMIFLSNTIKKLNLK